METKALKQLAKSCGNDKHGREWSNGVGFKDGKAIVTNGRILIQWKHGDKTKAKSFVWADVVKKLKGNKVTIKRNKIVCDDNEKEFILPKEADKTIGFPFEAVAKVMSDSDDEMNKKRNKPHKVGLMVSTVKQLLKAFPDDAVITFYFPKDNAKAVYFHTKDKAVDGLLMPCRI